VYPDLSGPEMAKQLADMSADPLFPLELVTARTAVVPDDAGNDDDDNDVDDGDDGDDDDDDEEEEDHINDDNRRGKGYVKHTIMI